MPANFVYERGTMYLPARVAFASVLFTGPGAPEPRRNRQQLSQDQINEIIREVRGQGI